MQEGASNGYLQGILTSMPSEEHSTSVPMDLNMPESDPGVLLLSPDLLILDSNEAGHRYLKAGRRTESQIARRKLQDFRPEMALKIRDFLESHNTEESFRISEFTPDGTALGCSVCRLSALNEPLVLLTITGQPHGSPIREKQDYLSKIAEHIPAILYAYDVRAGKNIYLSSQFANIMGWDATVQGPIDNQYFEKNLHPDDAALFPDWMDRWQQAQDNQVYSLRYRLRDAHGHYRWFQTHDTVLQRDESGSVELIAGSAIEITELLNAERGLNYEQARLEAIARAAPFSIMETDETGTIAYLNRIQFNSGWNADEIIGMSIYDFIDPEHHLRLRQSMDRALLGNPDAGVELKAPARDGQIRWIRLKINPLEYKSDVGLSRNLLIIGEDISTRKQMELRMEQLSARAQSANRAKTEFFVGLSHDIRTPMNSILGIAELLLESDLSEEQRKLASILRDSTDALLGLLEQTLQLSRVEMGLLDSERLKPVSTRALIGKMLSLFTTEAEATGTEIQTNIAPEIPDSILCFEKGLLQLLVNLVGNAIKYTGPGQVKVGLSLPAEKELPPTQSGGRFLLLEVQDTGPGIPSDELPFVFDLFYRGSARGRAENTGSTAYGGKAGNVEHSGNSEELANNENPGNREAGRPARVPGNGEAGNVRQAGEGIGLNGCRRILDIAGGHIEILSPFPPEGPGGTLVRVLYPFEEPEEANSKSGKTGTVQHSQPSLPEDTHILLVEDNQINQLVATRMLESWNITVDTAETVAAAMERIRHRNYNLILLDLGLPDADGRTLARWIRKQGWTMPLVALTAAAFDEEKESALESGMDEFLTKPINKESLRQTIYRLISKKL